MEKFYQRLDCPHFMNKEWIHPLFQVRLYNLIQHTEKNCPGVTHLIVFGSVARGDCTEDSDIDLYILGDPDGTFYTPLDDDTEYDVLWDKFMKKPSPLFDTIWNEGLVIYGPVVTGDCK